VRAGLATIEEPEIVGGLSIGGQPPRSHRGIRSNRAIASTWRV
jgi:hypothetical protein